MDGRALAGWRMNTVGLRGHRFATPADVVRWFGAVQAQDYAPATWSVGQRLAAHRDTEVDRLFDEGVLLRTHVLRPTWHFVLPEDIRWLLALTAPRVHALNAYQYRRAGLDAATRVLTRKLLAGALRGGTALTRQEIAGVCARAGQPVDGTRLTYILMDAELEGLVCSGPRRGRRHTYLLLDERVPPAAPRTGDEALVELVVRYFTGHGPATVADLRWWSSLTVADIRHGLDLAGDRLHREVVGGRAYWFAEPPPSTSPPTPTVHLLQAYDEYVVGYAESKDLLDPAPGPRPLYNHVVVLDGRVAGAWQRTVGRDEVVVRTRLRRPLDEEQHAALRAAADRHAAFLGRRAYPAEPDYL